MKRMEVTLERAATIWWGFCWRSAVWETLFLAAAAFIWHLIEVIAAEASLATAWSALSLGDSWLGSTPTLGELATSATSPLPAYLSYSYIFVMSAIAILINIAILKHVLILELADVRSHAAALKPQSRSHRREPRIGDFSIGT
jgi:hypothetical protein